MGNIKVYNLSLDNYTEWVLPTKNVLLEHSKNTWGTRYDKIEHELVSGGLPYVIRKK